ncbi:EpsG family protein [Pectobacterium aroidearum]|uniref:EpsG family protein n=1 Tax=Pectobacterium aroidearum TaxID=1201031 RepID=UPI0030192CF2
MPFILIFMAIFFSWLSVFFFDNPDLANYNDLIENCSLASPCSVEPLLWLLSDVSRFVNRYSDLNLTYLVYFFYQLTMLVAVSMTAKNIFLNKFKSLAFFFLWLFCFSPIVLFVQIRFGLAAALTILSYSYLLEKKERIKSYLSLLLAISSHFATLPHLISSFFLYKKESEVRNITLTKYFTYAGCISLALLFLKNGYLISYLPDFMSARISIYLNMGWDEVSSNTRDLSICMFLILTLSLVLNREKKNIYLVLGSFSFLPYMITPEIEIFVRFGLPFQYFLLVHFIDNIKSKSWWWICNSSLAMFFLYKMISNVYYLNSI